MSGTLLRNMTLYAIYSLQENVPCGAWFWCQDFSATMKGVLSIFLLKDSPPSNGLSGEKQLFLKAESLPVRKLLSPFYDCLPCKS